MMTTMKATAFSGSCWPAGLACSPNSIPDGNSDAAAPAAAAAAAAGSRSSQVGYLKSVHMVSM